MAAVKDVKARPVITVTRARAYTPQTGGPFTSFTRHFISMDWVGLGVERQQHRSRHAIHARQQFRNVNGAGIAIEAVPQVLMASAQNAYGAAAAAVANTLHQRVMQFVQIKSLVLYQLSSPFLLCEVAAPYWTCAPVGQGKMPSHPPIDPHHHPTHAPMA